MPDPRWPGVYVQEVRVTPPPIAERDSAVPGFVGYTATARDARGADLTGRPQKIQSLAEFERWFGPGHAPRIEVHATRDPRSGELRCTVAPPPAPYLLHASLRLYLDNGGGPCHVVSVGGFDAPVAAAALRQGIAALAAVEEVTLLAAPDAVRCDDAGFASVVQALLAQCGGRRERFAILDVQRGDAALGANVAAEREKFGTQHLSYGAAYLPFLRTVYPYPLARDAAGREGTNVFVSGPGTEPARTLAEAEVRGEAALAAAVRSALALQRQVLPPSGAVAGVYCRVDRTRGVWKAPANESVNAVEAPVVAISATQQDALAVDPASGRSLNVIRRFDGRGVRVWGARTLAGNDNEWRYVSVRRFCGEVEQAITRGTAWVTFEPNDATTWVRVRSAVENYLTALWREGALQGNRPEHAYFVACGVGRTMTAQDVAEGRIVIEVGLAVVRPAEFVVLRIVQRVAGGSG